MSAISLDPYIFFQGNAREAMDFYKSIFGGELTLQTNAEAGATSDDRPADNIMHAALEGGEVRIFGCDSSMASPKSAKVTLCLGGDDEEKLTTVFNRLSEGANVQSPLKKEFWGDTFGMLTDKYGVDWMVNILAKKE